jgi:hypothetical protein
VIAPVWQVATIPGDPSRPNEDYAGVLGNCAVLLDGSGAPGDLPTGCVHGVPWFVRQLGARCLAKMAAGEPGQGLAGILAAAITEVSALHWDTCDLNAPGTPSSMIVMVRASSGALDFLVLGDSAFVAEDRSGKVTAVTDKRMDDVAPPEYRQMLALPISSPERQAVRVEFVRKQQPLRNAPGGYPVASTDPRAAHQAITGSVPAGDLRRFAMVSDGVTRFADFGLGSWGDMLDVLTAEGPSQLFSRIREAEDSDLECRKWPRAKKSDDVSVVFQGNAK